MKKYSLTYDDALRMYNRNTFNFRKSETMIDGYKIVTFTYFLCSYDVFMNPFNQIDNIPDVNALDMRGVTFVFNHDKTLFKRFLMLPKFFNLNQNESTQYDAVKDKKIVSAANKEDGSLVAFMYLPNGKLFTKTIGGFDNDQVIESNKIVENDKNLENLIREMLFDGFTPLFEYVSFKNKIVLNYGKSELRFIGVRDNITDEYVPAGLLPLDVIKVFEDNNISYIKNENKFTLDELIEKCNIEKNTEGYVVIFDDGQMIKLKTKWYYELHGLMTESAHREDSVIEYYLKDKIDEMLSQFDHNENREVVDFITKCTIACDNYLKYIGTTVSLYIKLLNENYNGNTRQFYIENHNITPFFNLIKTLVDYGEEKYEERKIEFILRATFKLKDARFFVEKWS